MALLLCAFLLEKNNEDINRIKRFFLPHYVFKSGHWCESDMSLFKWKMKYYLKYSPIFSARNSNFCLPWWAITFYSILGKFDQILLKIVFNTYKKYIFKIDAVSFSEIMSKMFFILLISIIITTWDTRNSFLSNQYDFLLWHATRWILNL